MNRQELILTPTPELLDEALLEINNKNNEAIEAYERHHNIDANWTRWIDEALDQEEITQKTKAEKYVRDSNPTGWHEMQQAYRNKKRLEAELSQMKMNYYHAREKLDQNRQIDVNASLHWERFNS